MSLVLAPAQQIQWRCDRTGLTAPAETRGWTVVTEYSYDDSRYVTRHYAPRR